jgi:hypothetical protein
MNNKPTVRELVAQAKASTDGLTPEQIESSRRNFSISVAIAEKVIADLKRKRSKQ